MEHGWDSRADSAGDDFNCVGVDFGTSRTRVACSAGGVARVIPLPPGARSMESLLAVKTSGEIVVGRGAANERIFGPERTACAVRRLLGLPAVQGAVEDATRAMPFAVKVEGARVAVELAGRTLPVREVVGRILRVTRRQAEQRLGAKALRAALTVPSSFGLARREVLRRAAASAGFASVQVVGEATAAAVAFMHESGGHRRIAVVSLGAGTLDVAIVDARERRAEVVASGGDVLLGGMDLDARIADLILDRFARARGGSFPIDAVQRVRLLEAAAECKAVLASAADCEVRIPGFAFAHERPVDLEARIEASAVERAVADIHDRMVAAVADALRSENVPAESIDELVLVGGGSRWSPIRARLEALFGRRSARRIDAEEGAVMGAALLVDPASGMEAHEVLGRSLWFQSECGRPIRLAKRNAPVPLTRSFVVGVVARAGDSARIPLLEGEAADAEGNEDAGCVMVDASADDSADRRVYEIALSVDPYGMSAKAVVVGEERSVEARVEPAGARSSDAEAVAARALPPAGDRESGISLGRRLWKNASRMWTGRGQAV